MISFDEVGSVKIKDSNTIEILKDYMANGRFSRGVTVIANASLGFIGNIDHSIEQLVNSPQFDLFEPLPEVFDLAVMDRFHTYLPGWEIPKNSSELLTRNYGFITDYLAEVFHYLSKKVNRYEYVNRSCRFGRALQGRDEVAIKKTLCALIKLLHPVDNPTAEELGEYMAYAVEGRRRVKEQMNKRKADDEFASINLSYFNAKGDEVVVFCPESRDAPATQNPTRRVLEGARYTEPAPVSSPPTRATPPSRPPSVAVSAPTQSLREKHFRIGYGDTGHTYESIFGDFLKGAREITVEDAYIRQPHQIGNFLRFCELVVKADSAQVINLVTGYDEELQREQAEEKLKKIGASLLDHGIKLNLKFSETLHDREIRLDNGWTVKIGRGFDIYQRVDYPSIGASDTELRPCLETSVDIFRR
jgi:ATP-dependent Lon protease